MYLRLAPEYFILGNLVQRSRVNSVRNFEVSPRLVDGLSHKPSRLYSSDAGEMAVDNARAQVRTAKYPAIISLRPSLASGFRYSS